MMRRWEYGRSERLCSMSSDLLLLGVGNRAAGPAPSRLVQEADGASRFTLEDSSGNLLLE